MAVGTQIHGSRSTNKICRNLKHFISECSHYFNRISAIMFLNVGQYRASQAYEFIAHRSFPVLCFMGDSQENVTIVIVIFFNERVR